MKRSSIILILLFLACSLNAQETPWEEDSLLKQLIRHPDIVFNPKSSVFSRNGLLDISPSERWKTVEHVNFINGRKPKLQRVVLNGIYYGFEKWFSDEGDITHVFDHKSGKQVFGEKLNYSKYRESARMKADSLVQVMFTDSFFFQHIPFCANHIWFDYSIDGRKWANSVHFFDRIPVKPYRTRFYYAFVFEDAPILWRQVYIELDSSLNVVSTWPDFQDFRNYDFQISFNDACRIAKRYGYAPEWNIDIAMQRHLPFMKFNETDYFWYFAKKIGFEIGSPFSTENGTYLIINARTGESEIEEYEIKEIY